MPNESVLVAEPVGSEWGVSVFDKESGALRSFTLVTALLAEGESIPTSFLLAQFSQGHPMAAMVFLLDMEGDITKNDFPVSVICMPRWLAIAQAIETDGHEALILDTTREGRLALLQRSSSGLFEPVGTYLRRLADLWGISETPLQCGDGDYLLELLARELAVRGVLKEGGAELALRSRVESLAVSQPEAVARVLAQVLLPLSTALVTVNALTGASILACSGSFFESPRLHEIFVSALDNALRTGKSKLRPLVRNLSGVATCHSGAWRAVAPILAGEGVWAEQHGAIRSKYRLVSRREISYSVVHTALPAFDDAEDSIVEFVAGRPVLAVLDSAVDHHYGASIRAYLDNHTNCLDIVELVGAENQKTLVQVEKVCQAAIRANLRRDGVVLGIGGGVVLDISGFAASIYRRGVPFLRVPTTLVGLVDVGVGIKQGVNWEDKKNILGSFYPAIGSVNDINFLRTLTARDIACGIAEIAKMGLVRDRRLFELLESHGSELVASRFDRPQYIASEVLSRAEHAMMQELQKNLFEADLQRLVDFGHSFSPRIEAKSGYQIPHGEAVALDMLLCSIIAAHRQDCPRDLPERLIRLFESVGLPVSQDVCDTADLVAALDGIRVHRGGRLNLVVPTEIGKAAFVQDVEYADVNLGLRYMSQRAKQQTKSLQAKLP